jgi:hypothetical protein
MSFTKWPDPAASPTDPYSEFRGASDDFPFVQSPDWMETEPHPQGGARDNLTLVPPVSRGTAQNAIHAISSQIQSLENELQAERARGRKADENSLRLENHVRNLEREHSHWKAQAIDAQKTRNTASQYAKSISQELDRMRAEVVRYRNAWSDIQRRQLETQALRGENEAHRAKILSLENDVRAYYQQWISENGAKSRLQSEYAKAKASLDKYVAYYPKWEAHSQALAKELETLKRACTSYQAEITQLDSDFHVRMEREVKEASERFAAETEKQRLEWEKKITDLEKQRLELEKQVQAVQLAKTTSEKTLNEKIGEQTKKVFDLNLLFAEETETHEKLIATLKEKHEAEMLSRTEEQSKLEAEFIAKIKAQSIEAEKAAARIAKLEQSERDLSSSRKEFSRLREEYQSAISVMLFERRCRQDIVKFIHSGKGSLSKMDEASRNLFINQIEKYLIQGDCPIVDSTVMSSRLPETPVPPARESVSPRPKLDC